MTIRAHHASCCFFVSCSPSESSWFCFVSPSPSPSPSLSMTFSNCDHRASTDENSLPTCTAISYMNLESYTLLRRVILVENSPQ